MDVTKCPFHNKPEVAPADDKCPVSNCDREQSIGNHDNPDVEHTMRAVRVNQYGDPETMALESVPRPSIRDDQILIKVFTAGVNPLDSQMRSGQVTEFATLPFTPGFECSGIVEKVGNKITKFKMGERVYTYCCGFGTHAEYFVAPEAGVHHLHSDLTFSQGAALGSAYYTAYKTLFIEAKAKAGQSVLVHGASGGVGLACCQMGRAYGLQMAGTAGSSEGMKLATKHGLHFVANHNVPEHVQQLKDVTRGKGYDIIVEMAADRNLQNDIELLKEGGKIMVVGTRGEHASFNVQQLMIKSGKILGIETLWLPQNETDEISAAIHAGIDHGWLRPYVGEEYPLSEAAIAHRSLTERKTYGKIILSTV